MADDTDILARECRIWNEGCSNWWLLSDIRRLPTPIPCRGNVGMWQVPEGVSDSIDEQLAGGYPA